MRTCELGLATLVSNFELEARDEKMKEGAVILVVDMQQEQLLLSCH